MNGSLFQPISRHLPPVLSPEPVWVCACVCIGHVCIYVCVATVKWGGGSGEPVEREECNLKTAKHKTAVNPPPCSPYESALTRSGPLICFFSSPSLEVHLSSPFQLDLQKKNCPFRLSLFMSLCMQLGLEWTRDHSHVEKLSLIIIPSM